MKQEYFGVFDVFHSYFLVQFYLIRGQVPSNRATGSQTAVIMLISRGEREAKQGRTNNTCLVFGAAATTRGQYFTNSNFLCKRRVLGRGGINGGGRKL